MLELPLLRSNPELVIARLAKKHFEARPLVTEILNLDAERRALQTQRDQLLAQINQLSKQIGQLMTQGQVQEAEALKQQSGRLKQQVQQLEHDLEQKQSSIHDLLVRLPNLPAEAVPEGRSAGDNVIVRSGGAVPELPPDALPHWDLAARYGLIDFEAGAKVTGAGFPFYRGAGAKLQRALISFFLDQAIACGYTEYEPPLLVNADTAFGTGQLPDKDQQMYFVPADALYLIPTAEVPLTNIYRDEIIEEHHLPVKLTAYSACFRREAGSYGKDVRGLNRLHQFDKVEIVRIEHPDRSYQALEEMVHEVERLVQMLELPYRIVKLCGGDMSFASALTYDVEVYCAVQQRWLEVSSISNFETFQSQRMKLRYRDAQGKTHLAHTLNGSALALPRIVASLLENNQSEDGIRLPACLHSYMGGSMLVTSTAA
ncbi:MAG: serine--tRNA ligase [Chitinophagales bacterium]|nr:serine--tRNA ligase [Chitinophagales bacterium]MDW8427793.1 serine--tRNA ligase [Chitinophagales bacterium]